MDINYKILLQKDIEQFTALGNEILLMAFINNQDEWIRQLSKICRWNKPEEIGDNLPEIKLQILAEMFLMKGEHHGRRKS